MISTAAEPTGSTTAIFSRYAVGLKYEEIPPAVIEAAKLQFLDTLRCGLAAYGVGIGAYTGAITEMGGPAETSAISLEGRLGAANAAFANGILCHAVDFDTTYPGSRCHIGTVVVPAALAVAEARSISGRELVTAVICGKELVARIGAAAAGRFHERGFHPT